MALLERLRISVMIALWLWLVSASPAADPHAPPAVRGSESPVASEPHVAANQGAGQNRFPPTSALSLDTKLPVDDGPPRAFHVRTVEHQVQALVSALAENIDVARWDQAFKVFDQIRDMHPRGLIETGAGAWISVDAAIRGMLVRMPESGRRAFRIFYDPQAEQYLQAARAEAERENLEQVYRYYLPAACGAEALNRLADLEFEDGNVRRAIELWKAVLQDCPDAAIAPAYLHCKILIAAGRADAVRLREETRRSLLEQHADTPVTLGGETQLVREWVAGKLGADQHPDRFSSLRWVPPPPGELEVVWRFPLHPAQDQAGRQQPVVGTMNGRRVWRMEGGRLVMVGASQAELPAAVWAGDLLVLNLGASVLALNAGSGTVAWHVHDGTAEARDGDRQPTIRRPNTLRSVAGRGLYGVRVGGAAIWAVVARAAGRTELVSIRRSEGTVAFRSGASTDWKGWDFRGEPLLVEGILCVCGIRSDRPNDLFLHGFGADDAKSRWSVQLGSYASVSPGQVNPTPLLSSAGERAFVSLRDGTVMQVDLRQGAVRWARAWVGPADASGPHLPPTPARALISGGTLFFKPAGTRRIVALDADKNVQRWLAPCFLQSELADVDDTYLLTGGPEVSMYETGTGRLCWTMDVGAGAGICVPALSSAGVVVSAGDQILLLDAAAGQTVRQWTVPMVGRGRRILLSGDGMYVVTNREVVALRAAASHPSSDTPASDKTLLQTP